MHRTTNLSLDRRGRVFLPRHRRARRACLELLEPRTLLSLNITITNTHAIQVVEGPESNNLTVAYDSATNTYTFTDPNTTPGAVTDNSGDPTNVTTPVTNGFSISSANAFPALSIDTGGGNDTVNLRGEGAPTSITNATTVNIGAGGLSLLTGPVTVNGLVGTTTMQVNAAGQTSVNSSTAGTITFASAPTITYTNLAQITINNAPSTPPVGGAAETVNATVGQSVANAEVATFTDAAAGATTAQFATSIDWGDGTTTAGSVTEDASHLFHVTGTHTYAAVGTFTLTTTVLNNGGTNTTTVGGVPITTNTVASAATALSPTGTAVVSPVATNPLTATGVTGIPATAGTPLPGSTVVASFTDTNLSDTPADFTVGINWGDGTTTAGTVVANGAGMFNVTGGHTYTTAGTSSIVVSIANKLGNSATAFSSANVADATITLTGTPISAFEGLPFTGLVATFTSGNPSAVASGFTATIDWGDGTTTAGAIAEDASNTFHVSGTHTYKEEGSFTPTITVKGVTTTVSASPTATVADSPLSPGLGAPVLGTEGASLTSIVATFTDANQGAPVSDFTAEINWGDGTSSAGTVTAEGGTPNGGLFSVSGTHTYDEEGAYLISVTINDVGGSRTIARTQASIKDAPLTGMPITITPTAQFAFRVPVASFTDANPNGTASDFHAVIDWGDGTPSTTGSVVANGSGGFNVIGAHTYSVARTEPYTITVTIKDTGGAKTIVSSSAKVGGIVIPLAGILNPSSDHGAANFDAITNDNQPNFVGTTLPGTVVQLFATPTTGGPSQLIGLTSADGAGFWSINSFLLGDGSYVITATASDLHGNTPNTIIIEPATHPLVIDTVGPRVTAVSFDRLHGAIDVTFQDDRSGLDQASLLNAVNYSLVLRSGPFSKGPFILTSIVPTSTSTDPTAPETIALTFNGGKAIRGGFYTFTILSGAGVNGVRDIAGNALDGEFYGFFPSGNGIPGGNFVAELDAIHQKIFAPKSTVGNSFPVVSPPPTILPVINPKTGKVIRKQSLAQKTSAAAVHDAALAQLQIKRLQSH
jgi:hypothetical protein